MVPAKLHRTANLEIICLSILWCICIIIINPTGDFPLNDDWSFGLTVKHLVEKGEYRPTGWASMPFVSQALWGAIFCLPKGFSFLAVRFSTLAISFIGIIIAFKFMKQLSQNRWLDLIAVVVLAFNPIFFALSNTFMTDIPFTTMVLLASLFLLKNLISDSDTDLILGIIFAVSATLCRQLGLALPIAFGITLLAKRGFKIRYIVRAITPLALTMGIFFLFQHWLTVTGRLPALYHLKTKSLFHALTHPRTLISNFFINIFVSLCYFGWFLSPLLSFFIPLDWNKIKNDQRVILIILIVGIFILNAGLVVLHMGRLMPIAGNIIVPSGIGPLTLRDTFMNFNLMKPLPGYFWLFVTILSFLGGGVLVVLLGILAKRLWRSFCKNNFDDRDTSILFLLLSMIIYLAPLMVSHFYDFYDRYLIPILPVFIGIIAAGFGREVKQIHWSRIGGAVFFSIILIVFAVGGTRDYLTWNKKRWSAINHLLKIEKKEPRQIDGGFEFNGLYLYDPHYKRSSKKSWWWVDQDTYMVTFGQIPGFHIYKKFPYYRWLPWRQSRIIILEKDE